MKSNKIFWQTEKYQDGSCNLSNAALNNGLLFRLCHKYFTGYDSTFMVGAGQVVGSHRQIIPYICRTAAMASATARFLGAQGK
jgi:hypothetical protein